MSGGLPHRPSARRRSARRPLRRGLRGGWTALVVLSALALLAACGQRSGDPGVEDAARAARAVAAAEAELAEAEEALERVFAATADGQPDCARACPLADRICELSDRICGIAETHAGAADHCSEARGRCERARSAVGERCVCPQPDAVPVPPQRGLRPQPEAGRSAIDDRAPAGP